MALIPCPHCGKQISDTSGKCIHCGESLIQEVEKQKYNKLTDKEKTALREEFYNCYHTYRDYNLKKAKYFKRSSIIGFLGLGCGGILLFMQLLSFLTGKKIFSSNDFVLYIAVCLAILMFVLLITCGIMATVRAAKSGKYRRNDIIIEKKFQKWLLENKNIEYNVAVNYEETDRNFFASIDINKIDIER